MCNDVEYLVSSLLNVVVRRKMAMQNYSYFNTLYKKIKTDFIFKIKC